MRSKLKRMVCNTVPRPIRPAIASIFRSCRNKRTYNTPELAQVDIHSIHKFGRDTNPGFPLRPYKCDVCFAWHIGHDTRHPKFRT